MASALTPRANPSATTRSFRAEALDIFRETIGSKLRCEKLRPLKQACDEAVLAMDLKHRNPSSFFLKHFLRYE